MGSASPPSTPRRPTVPSTPIGSGGGSVTLVASPSAHGNGSHPKSQPPKAGPLYVRTPWPGPRPLLQRKEKSPFDAVSAPRSRGNWDPADFDFARFDRAAKMPQYTSRDVGDPSQIKKNKQSMADLKLRRLTELNSRLREDLERERIPVSQAAKR